MREFNDYSSLKSETTHVIPDELVYLKGYNSPIDGGGGHFVWDADSGLTNYDGMIVKPTNETGDGRWIRVNYEEVSVKFFGAYGALNNGAEENDTAAIQAAIDYVENQNSADGGVVFIPTGVYFTEEIILKDGVSIYGEYEGTIIRPWKDDQSFGYQPLVTIASGPVKRLFVKNLHFSGFDQNNDASTSHCFFIESKPLNLNDKSGGLWQTSFDNIFIRSFLGHGFYFLGGGMDQQGTLETKYDFLLPNQFISLENVRVVRSNTTTSRALLMEGQNGQFTMTDCTFSNIKNPPQGAAKVGTNVQLIGILGFENVQNRTGPSVINFMTCTIEDAELAVEIDACRTINIEGCWFENLNNSILVKQESLGILVNRSRFSNASNFGVFKPPGLPVVEYILISNTSSSAFTNNIIQGNYSNDGTNSGSGGTVRFNITPGNINLFLQNNYRFYNGPIIF